MTLFSEGLKSSLIFYSGNFFLSIFRYLFHIVLLRLLTPSQYGEFLTFLSLIYLLSIPTNTIATITTRSVSSFSGKKDDNSINTFFYFILQKTFYPLLMVGTIVVIFSTPLATLFSASNIAFIVLGISCLTAPLQTIVGSYLLGLHLLLKHSLFGLITAISTILLSFLLIYLKLGSLGAVIGQVAGGLIATVIALFWISPKIFPKSTSHSKFNLNLRSLTNYSLLNSSATLSFMSIDILLARIILDPHQSGIYSSLSVIGRTIIFGLSPLSTLVLTYASKKHAAGTKLKPMFFKLSLVIFLLGVSGAAIFNLFPHQIARVLGGTNFQETGNFLGLFSLSMVLFSWNQFILSFFNGIGREKNNIYYAFFALLQPIIIITLAKDILALTYTSFGLQLSLFICLLFLLLKPRVMSVKINHGSNQK